VDTGARSLVEVATPNKYRSREKRGEREKTKYTPSDAPRRTQATDNAYKSQPKEYELE
jgi:hypothetical protein